MFENSPPITEFEEGLPESPPASKGLNRKTATAAVALLLVVAVLSIANIAQNRRTTRQLATGTLVGIVINEQHQVVQAEIIIPGTEFETVADANGAFELSSIPVGRHDVLIALNYAGIQYPAIVAAGEVTNMGTIEVISSVRADGRADYR